MHFTSGGAGHSPYGGSAAARLGAKVKMYVNLFKGIGHLTFPDGGASSPTEG